MILWFSLTVGDEETMDTIEEESTAQSVESVPPQVFVPGTKLKEGEELVHDSSTYHMYHVVSKGRGGASPS